MKFTCYKNDLVEAMQILIHFVAVKPMTTGLSGVYLKANEEGLELQTNNLNMGARLNISLTVNEPGEVVVSGKTFYDFVRNMPEDTITLFGDEAAPVFFLESGGAHIELLTMPVGEFIKVKDQDTYGSFKIRSNVLKNMIRKTVFAVTKDNERLIFRGCCFEISGNRLNLIATNAQRIAVASEEFQRKEDEFNEHVTFVVPPEALRCLMQYFDPNDVENVIEIKHSGRIATFEFDKVFMYSRIIDGEFPSYDRAFETDYKTTLEVDKAEFRQAVELIALNARTADFNAIRFDIMPSQTKVWSSSNEVSEARRIIESNLSGDPLEIAFNVDYILDVLRVLDSKRIHIKFGDRYEPALFSEDGNENYSYVVTPVRI